MLASSPGLPSTSSSVVSTASGGERHAEALYVQHGTFANAYSVAFDPDLERHWWRGAGDGGDGGIQAYARCDLLGVTCGFFDPLCAEDDARHVIDDFIATTRSASPNERLVFWKVGAAAAEHLSRRGFHIAPYGLENDVVMTAKQLDLRGTSLRGLRRQITAARRNGVYVEALSPSSSRAEYAELECVTARWRATRPQQLEARRVTRRTPHRDEPHCTKVVARLSTDGTAVGWAALDHIYEGGALVGCGLNACRYDPAVSDGIASLLALDGAALVRGTLGESNAGGCARPFKLALGESPLIEFPTTRGIFFGESERRSRFVEGVFRLVRERGRWIYGVGGIAAWKRKWRAAEQPTTFVAVDSARPVRASAAALALILV